MTTMTNTEAAVQLAGKAAVLQDKEQNPGYTAKELSRTFALASIAESLERIANSLEQEC